MSALEPTSELLGEEYAKDVDAESGHHLHLRAARLTSGGDGAEGLWRISLHAVDAWVLRTSADTADLGDKGPFARLLGAP